MATSFDDLISFAKNTQEKLPSPIIFPNKKSSGIGFRRSWDPFDGGTEAAPSRDVIFRKFAVSSLISRHLLKFENPRPGKIRRRKYFDFYFVIGSYWLEEKKKNH